VHNAVLGEITVTFGPKGEPSVPKAALIDMLLPLLDADPELLSRMQSIRDWNGNVSLDAVEKTGFVVELDRSHLRLSRATIVMSTPPRSPVPPGVPQSTRMSLLDLTVTSGTAKLGGITAQVFGTSTIRIPKAALIDMLSPLFDAASVASIEKLPEVRGHVAIADLEAGGFLVKIERNHLDITRRGAAASSTRAAKSEEAPIGSAGRLAPVVHNGDVLGEVQVRSSPDNQILLTKSALVDILTPVLEKEPSTLNRLVSLPDRDDQVALEALQTAGVQVRYTGGRVEFGSRVTETETPSYSKPVSSRLNPTGRTIVMNVPLIEGETRLGEVLVRIEPDGRIIVPKASLVQQLAPVLDQAALARLEKILCK